MTGSEARSATSVASRSGEGAAGEARRVPGEAAWSLFGRPLAPLLSLVGLAIATVLLPMISVLSTRSSPLLLSLATTALLFARLAEPGGLAALRREMTAIARSPLVPALLFFASGAFLSALWSQAPATSLDYATRLAGNIALGFFFAVGLSGERAARVLRMLLIGLALALPFLLSELEGTFAIRPYFGGEPTPDELNRTVLTLSALAATALALALASSQHRLAAALLAGLAVAVAVFSASQSADLFWLVVALAAPVAWLAPRLAAWGLALSAIAVTALFPFVIGRIGEPLKALLATEFGGFARESSAIDRLNIWMGYASVVEERFLLGWGYAAERFFGPASPQDLPLIVRTGAHPHDLAIQLWLNLGLLGFVLAALIAAAMLRVLLRTRSDRLPGAVTLLAGFFAVWMVGHGAFQEWWLALVALVLTLLLRTSGDDPAATAKADPAGRS
ncbi:O-antigen ligase family protein [Afifella pfennigii]|uniref:O-antigen ligase family protein n=1 Tax=Afifella pfennigii TaxID=209897 RepID=UPI00047B2E17|nr:O-antigen ligase family protein [Afifella pfennigii]